MCVIIYLHKLSAPAPLPPSTIQLTQHSMFCTSLIMQSVCACAAVALGSDVHEFCKSVDILRREQACIKMRLDTKLIYFGCFCLMWMADLGFDYRQGQDMSQLFRNVQTSPGPNQVPVHWVSGVIFLA